MINGKWKIVFSSFAELFTFNATHTSCRSEALASLVFALNSLSLTEAAAFRRSIIQSGSGTFVGVIVNMKGKRIRGASVTVTGTSLTREVKPNRDGYFELDLPVGTYTITVKKSGFATYSLTELKIKSNGGFSHVFRLEPSHAWVHEQRTVEEPIKDP